MPDTSLNEFTLPSGRKAAFRKGKGKDMRKAARLVDDPTDQVGMGMALVAVLATIDGQPITIEDMDEMDLSDVQALMQGFAGKNASSPKTIS